MPHRTLNLGILAHVDAGKTTLTERLLYAAGVINEIGSVDAGTTQTDSLALEQERGITIKAAVVSFEIDDVTVNLIDTPGHPDFIAEVERVLSVLDGAVMVISAVEGVQPQTRVLMRALQRLRTPTLVFVNKIDRAGANEERVLEAISQRLGLAIVPMGSTRAIGTRHVEAMAYGADDEAFRARLAELLSEHDDALLAAYVDAEEGVPHRRLREGLLAQTERALVHPVFFGSAITGTGVDDLTRGIAELLPSAVGDAGGALSARVFKIERGTGGEKVAYVRIFSGTVRTRELVPFGNGREDRVTSVGVFEHGSVERRPSASAGQIAKLWGLDEVRIGDRVGEAGPDEAAQFAPPTLETVVVPRSPEDRGSLMVALTQLAEQDPLINVRQDDTRHEMSVSLYGEVQKEVIQATLASDYGIEVTFRETTTICIERPLGSGYAVAILQDDENPFSATVGLRVEPGPIGSGVRFRLDVDPRRIPTYVYKGVESFSAAMTQYVTRALEEGLFGWQVTDCVVTLDDCAYYIGDGPRKPTVPTPRTTASDFRKLTPMVLMEALEQARTVVCEPIVRVSAEVPPDTAGAVLTAVARLGGSVETPSQRGDLSVIGALVSAGGAQELIRQLPELTGGEGVIEATFGGYQPMRGASSERRRTMANPRNRVEYLMEVRGRAFRAAQ